MIFRNSGFCKAVYFKVRFSLFMIVKFPEFVYLMKPFSAAASVSISDTINVPDEP
jgi:hypothetical protein